MQTVSLILVVGHFLDQSLQSEAKQVCTVVIQLRVTRKCSLPRWGWKPVGVVFLPSKQRPSRSWLTSLEYFHGDPFCSESQISLQVCEPTLPRSWSSWIDLFILGGMIHLGLGAGVGGGARSQAEMLGCPGSVVWASTQVAAAPFPMRPRSAPPGVSAGGEGSPQPTPLSAPGWEATQRCPAQVGQEANFVKVLVSFLWGGGGAKEELFSVDILFLVCRYQKETQHWACSDVEWFPDKQQPPGTQDLK